MVYVFKSDKCERNMCKDDGSRESDRVELRVKAAGNRKCSGGKRDQENAGQCRWDQGGG